MKVVILAGGLGTRLSEETIDKPKPMVEIGGKPMLWHIMKMYSVHGINDFVICCGYKGYIIKEYFSNYLLHQSDVTFDLMNESFKVHRKSVEPWKVTLIDTGNNSMTGGRLGRISEYVSDDDAFCFTYGDGVSDVNISKLIAFHKSHGKDATVTASYPDGRFGALEIKDSQVMQFNEKPRGDGALINSGFFVLSPKIFERISGDDCVWEQEPLKGLAKDGNLMSYTHEGFWQPMDTLRDKIYLEELWEDGNAPWKTW
jgi:glucose-1-phosphate cytidylyltransferase